MLYELQKDSEVGQNVFKPGYTEGRTPWVTTIINTVSVRNIFNSKIDC